VRYCRREERVGAPWFRRLPGGHARRVNVHVLNHAIAVKTHMPEAT
jgi:hypothetical protein